MPNWCFVYAKRYFCLWKNPGACLWGHKRPLREWGHALPRFSSQIGVFSYRKTLGRVFGGHKKPLREWGHALPGFGQVLVSNPGLEPGASGVRRPRASPLGNLTTVGHLAKISPDLSPHFRDETVRFLTHDGALGAKMGGNESYGRCASFQMDLHLSKYPPKGQNQVWVGRFWGWAQSEC